MYNYGIWYAIYYIRTKYFLLAQIKIFFCFVLAEPSYIIILYFVFENKYFTLKVAISQILQF